MKSFTLERRCTPVRAFMCSLSQLLIRISDLDYQRL